MHVTTSILYRIVCKKQDIKDY